MTHRVLLVSDAPFESRVRSALPELNGDLLRWDGDPSALYVHRRLDELLASAPDVVTFGPTIPAESVLEIAADLDRLHPEVEVVVFAEPSPKLWETAARAGVRELVAPGAESEELSQAMRRTFATVDARRAQHRAPSSSADPVNGAVIVVRSPKGGSGKTMVSSNVAVALAKRHPGDVVVVDLDLQYGDLASALGIEPQYTIADATANVDLTPTSLKALLSTHSSSLYLLSAPSRPEDADVITGADVTAVVALLQAAFRFVVIDTAAGTDERTLAALAGASDVVLVCSMDVSSVRAMRKDLESSHTMSATAHRHLVLNRADSRVGLDLRDIEATLGASIDVRISSTRSVPLHMNCGMPITDAEPSSPTSKQLKELAERLVPVAAAKASRTFRRRR